ncbi:MAG: hypothetical protein KY475_15245 [Planctomycetes bacterium]|nr:hypothetical protein [Planctomycetota bacterium]
MQTCFVFLLTFATAVHTVFGCCRHHALAVGDVAGEASSMAATSCVCAAHVRVERRRPATADEGRPAACVAAARDHAPQHPVQDDHQCHGAKCVSVLMEKAPAVDLSGPSAPFDVMLAAAALDAAGNALAPAAHEERLLGHAAPRPLRAHLLLEVLLI